MRLDTFICRFLFIFIPSGCSGWIWNSESSSSSREDHQQKLDPPKVPGISHKEHPSVRFWKISGRSGGGNLLTRQAPDDYDGYNSQRFRAEYLTNGIPYGKSGYRGTARLYAIEVEGTDLNYLTFMSNGGKLSLQNFAKFKFQI